MGLGVAIPHGTAEAKGEVKENRYCYAAISRWCIFWRKKKHILYLV